jgi:hypothetical protein
MCKNVSTAPSLGFSSNLLAAVVPIFNAVQKNLKPPPECTNLLNHHPHFLIGQTGVQLKRTVTENTKWIEGARF